MGANPEQSIHARRRELAKIRGEPVETVRREVVKQHESYYANLPPTALDLLDLTEEDALRIEQHDDRVVIRPLEENNA